MPPRIAPSTAPPPTVLAVRLPRCAPYMRDCWNSSSNRPNCLLTRPQRQYSIPGSELHKAYSLTNGNHLLAIYPGATGLKPGFTDEAGLCIVATATRGNRHLLAVLMGSDIVYGDAVRFLDYGFST